MGYLGPLLGALLVLAAGDSFEVRAHAPWAAAVFLLLPHLLARATRRAALAGSFRRANTARLALAAAPLVCFALAVLLGWRDFALELCDPPEHAQAWPHPWQAVALAPYAIYEVVAIDARARLTEASAGGRSAVRRFQLRMFGAALVPLLAFGASGYLVSLSPAVRIPIEEVAVYEGAFTFAVLAIIVALLPWLLRQTWDTRRMDDGPERTLFEGLARRAGFRYRELLLWRTGGRVANAAVVGFGARHRYVLLTDALLAMVSTRELAAVFAHEIGHATRKHVPILLVWALGWFVAFDVAHRQLELTGAGQLAALAVALGLWLLGFGWLCRRCELEADFEAMRLTGDADGLTEALRRISGRWSHGKHSWRHFSVDRRCEFLTAASASPTIVRALRRRIRGAALLALALFVVGLGFEARELADGYDTERIRAALRLGRWDWASDQLDRIPAEREWLAFLVERAGTSEPDVGRLTDRARVELSQGRVPQARADIELALLLGERSLRPVLDGLDALLDGRPDDAGAGLSEFGEGWPEALDSGLERLSAQGSAEGGTEAPNPAEGD